MKIELKLGCVVFSPVSGLVTSSVPIESMRSRATWSEASAQMSTTLL